MKHILKVASLQNLPSTRPIIAMDDEGNLFGEPAPVGPIIEVVDLGLSVKWAKCNLGAETETDYGDYYAWGEVETKSDYSWTTYTRHTNGTYSSSNKKVFIKYCPTSQESTYWAGTGSADNKLVLDLGADGDDIVNKLYGGNYRMPTEREFNELKNNTTSTWYSNYHDSGIAGREFVSNINGNTIFIPAAGYYYGSSLKTAGSGSRCWSSSLYQSYSDSGRYLYFSSSDIIIGNNTRQYGYSVRPVFKD